MLPPRACHHAQLNPWLTNSESTPMQEAYLTCFLPLLSALTQLLMPVSLEHMGETTRGHVPSCGPPGHLKASQESLEVTSLRERPPWEPAAAPFRGMSHTEQGGSKSKTFSNFVNCELVCFIFNVLNGGKIKVSWDAAVLLIEEFNCLPGDVHHACKHSTPSNSQGTQSSVQ